MSAIRIPCDEKAIAALPSATGEKAQYIARFNGEAGLFVVVGRQKRTFTVQADLRHGGQRATIRLSLGNVSLREARRRAREVLARVGRYSQARKLTTEQLAQARRALKAIAEGRDASPEELVVDPQGPTLTQAWTAYAAALAKKRRSQRTIDGYRDLVTRLLARWADTPLPSLATPAGIDEVRAEHDRLVSAHGPSAANAAFRALRAIYGHARRGKNWPDNPIDAIDFAKERGHRPVVIDLAAWNAERLRLPNALRREMHLFALFSGLRRETLLTMRWADVDMKKRLLHVPAPKGGTDRAFDLPLSKPMLRCLWRARRAGRLLHPRNAVTWIWPSPTSASGHISEIKEKKLAVSHALRRTLISIAPAAGVPKVFVKALVNHRSRSDVTDAYIVFDALRPQIAEAQEKLSAFIVKSIGQVV